MKIRFCVVLSLIVTTCGLSALKLPRLVSDGMVLQRNTKVKIWGWAAMYEKVSIRFLDSTYQTATDSGGAWKIVLANLNPGGPYTMQLFASDTITIRNILIGDVFLCSGQSNMETTMERVSPLYPAEIARSENPNIRYFDVPDMYNFNAPQNDLQGGVWKSPDPQSVLSFAAVPYFFAAEIYEKYKIPIGLINASLGGSPAEAWMSEDALKEFPAYYNEVQRFKDAALIAAIENSDRIQSASWYNQLNKSDEGYKNVSWRKPELLDADWLTMKIPDSWDEGGVGKMSGVVWFRKKIIVPKSMTGKPAILNLATIVDADSAFVNGVFVGSTSYRYPPRRYSVPSGILNEGENTIVVRVISTGREGGFIPDKPYQLIVERDTIDLKGEWKYRIGTVMPTLSGSSPIRWKPAGLYNAMIAPLHNVSIKGVLWYQGESNTDRPVEYRKLFPALIRDWRIKWDRTDLPFLYVQLPNFMEPEKDPVDHSWAWMREAQLQALSVPHTAMAVTVDIGEWNDVHPLNKKDVAKRLAFAALKIVYGENNVVHSGPLYQSYEIKGNKVYLTFRSIGGGLAARDGTLKRFAIAGKDKKFVWANAKIEKNRIIVWSQKVKNPAAVRYAWGGNPEGANLYNKEGLPASPFRTDDWDTRNKY